MLKMTQFAAAPNKASVDTVFGLAGQALQGVEQLAALNLQAGKTSLAEWAETAQAALSVKSPAELGTLATVALQAAPQKALAYARQVKDIFTAATAGQRTAVEAQVADAQAKFLEAVNGALKNAPGSENTLALVKSAVTATQDAFDRLNTTTKQVADAVEANVTKATETAVRTSRGALATIDA